MRPVYYQIELTPRQLSVLLIAIALLLVVAFGLGYGAAWSVLAHHRPGPSQPPSGGHGPVTAAPTATATAVRPEPSPVRTVASATATPAPATATPRSIVPTATPPPARATPTPVGLEEGFWVQVLASRRHASIEQARGKLEALDFPRDHHRVVQSTSAEGIVLYKLRVGPFPDRTSASRVQRRMRGSGFPDAWLVTP
jgi:cell division septation protein DedD